MTHRRRACFFGETQGLRSLTRTGIDTILMTTIMFIQLPIASICSTLENGMIGPVLIEMDSFVKKITFDFFNLKLESNEETKW